MMKSNRTGALAGVLLAIAAGSGHRATAQSAARVVLGEGREGLAFRVMWVEREDATRPARITKFTFPVACDYGSQEIRSVNPVLRGAELREDDHGNVTMVHATPIEIGAETPLCLGTVNDVVLYSRAFLDLKPRSLRRSKVPDEIRTRFTADDPILALTDPVLADQAARLKVDARNELDVVLRTWQFVHETVSYGRVKRPNTAPQVLQWREGQCGEFGKLTIALLRANGIPARGVWCLRAGNTGPAGNDHAWAEAWIGGIGWFPIRPQEKPPTNDQYPLGYHSYQVVCRPECGMDALRAVEWENVSCPTGYRGVGFFADLPEDRRAASIKLFRAIANDATGKAARDHLRRARKAHRAVEPMLYWLLAGSRDDWAGTQAAEALVKICGQPDRRLGIDRFVDVSPRLVLERITAARE